MLRVAAARFWGGGCGGGEVQGVWLRAKKKGSRDLGTWDGQGITGDHGRDLGVAIAQAKGAEGTELTNGPGLAARGEGRGRRGASGCRH
jgi:hypothetical protein